jgi:hypothetical protein
MKIGSGRGLFASAAAAFALAYFTAPASAGLDDFVGAWSNANPGTAGITHVVIQQLGPNQVNVRVYGSCHPTDCDWGTVEAHSYTESVGSPDVRSVTAHFHSGFSNDEIVFTRGGGGTLKYQLFVAFTDGSGRYDYTMSDHLDRDSGWGVPSPLPPGPPMPPPGPGPMAEDCVGFNPATATIAFVGGSWKFVDGPHWILDFGPNHNAAEQANHAIHHYHFDQQCFVTRASGSQMTYWKSGGGVPGFSMPGEDCIHVSPDAVDVQHGAGTWRVVDQSNNDWLLDYGPNHGAAQQAVSIIHSYGMNRQCFVNRSPGPPVMQYWLSH